MKKNLVINSLTKSSQRTNFGEKSDKDHWQTDTLNAPAENLKSHYFFVFQSVVNIFDSFFLLFYIIFWMDKISKKPVFWQKLEAITIMTNVVFQT